MRTYNVDIIFKDGTEDSTQVCAETDCEAEAVVKDLLRDENRSIGDVAEISYEQVYNEEDHIMYGSEYRYREE